MSLIQQLKARAAEQKPVRVAIIGAGKFGSMYSLSGATHPWRAFGGRD
jgi:predicted homoserine dehydrogenase-like protein